MAVHAIFGLTSKVLERLLELANEVDFAAFVFAQDDWTSSGLPISAVPSQGAEGENIPPGDRETIFRIGD